MNISEVLNSKGDDKTEYIEEHWQDVGSLISEYLNGNKELEPSINNIYDFLSAWDVAMERKQYDIIKTLMLDYPEVVEKIILLVNKNVEYGDLIELILNWVDVHLGVKESHWESWVPETLTFIDIEKLTSFFDKIAKTKLGFHGQKTTPLVEYNDSASLGATLDAVWDKYGDSSRELCIKLLDNEADLELSLKTIVLMDKNRSDASTKKMFRLIATTCGARFYKRWITDQGNDDTGSDNVAFEVMTFFAEKSYKSTQDEDARIIFEGLVRALNSMGDTHFSRFISNDYFVCQTIPLLGINCWDSYVMANTADSNIKKLIGKKIELCAGNDKLTLEMVRKYAVEPTFLQLRDHLKARSSLYYNYDLIESHILRLEEERFDNHEEIIQMKSICIVMRLQEKSNEGLTLRTVQRKLDQSYENFHLPGDVFRNDEMKAYFSQLKILVKILALYDYSEKKDLLEDYVFRLIRAIYTNYQSEEFTFITDNLENLYWSASPVNIIMKANSLQDFTKFLSEAKEIAAAEGKKEPTDAIPGRGTGLVADGPHLFNDGRGVKRGHKDALSPNPLPSSH